MQRRNHGKAAHTVANFAAAKGPTVSKPNSLGSNTNQFHREKPDWATDFIPNLKNIREKNRWIQQPDELPPAQGNS
jgi:hypothetical protein